MRLSIKYLALEYEIKIFCFHLKIHNNDGGIKNNFFFKNVSTKLRNNTCSKT